MATKQANPSDVLKNQAMQQVLLHAPLMALLGGGARGAVGLVNFLNRSTTAPPKPFRRRSLLRLPADTAPPVKMAQAPAATATAPAAPSTGPAPSGLGSYFSHPYLTRLAQGITDATGITVPGGTPSNRPATTAFMAGDHATHARDLPWALPATFGLGIASGLGGYHLMDKVLDGTRKMDVDSELEAAREEYEQALRGLAYKQAAAAPEPLADTFQWFEKTGGLGNIAGLYLTALLTAGAGTGLATYNYTRARSRDKILDEAAKRRRSQIFQQTKMPMFARIQPLPSPAPVDAHAANA